MSIFQIYPNNFMFDEELSDFIVKIYNHIHKYDGLNTCLSMTGGRILSSYAHIRLYCLVASAALEAPESDKDYALLRLPDPSQCQKYLSTLDNVVIEPLIAENKPADTVVEPVLIFFDNIVAFLASVHFAPRFNCIRDAVLKSLEKARLAEAPPSPAMSTITSISRSSSCVSWDIPRAGSALPEDLSRSLRQLRIDRSMSVGSISRRGSLVSNWSEQDSYVHYDGQGKNVEHPVGVGLY